MNLTAMHWQFDTIEMIFMTGKPIEIFVSREFFLCRLAQTDFILEIYLFDCFEPIILSTGSVSNTGALVSD